MKYRLVSLVIIFIIMLGISSLEAQDQKIIDEHQHALPLDTFTANHEMTNASAFELAAGVQPDTSKRPLLEQVRAMDMDSLERGRVTVHFTPGYKDRAKRLGANIKREIQLFRDSLDAELDVFHLILPDESHWEKLAEWPYGVPIWGLGGWQERNLGKRVSDRPASAIIPVDAKGAVYKQLLTHKQCLTHKHRKHLKKIDLSWEEAARLYVEAITFHEVGHAISDVYKIETPLWLSEFIPNYLGYAHLYYNEKTHAKVWDLITAVTLECQKPSHGRTLEEAIVHGQSANDYHWLQSYLIQRANQIVENHGFDFIRNAQEAFPPRSTATSDPLLKRVESLKKDREQLSDEEALRQLEEINQEILLRLERIAPGFHEWDKRFQQDEGDGS